MKKRRLVTRTIILIVLAAAVVYTLYSNSTQEAKDLQKVKVGKEAPDFVLTDLNGKEQQLSKYKGQGVLLNFWGTWCKPCEREMPYLEKISQVMKDQGVKVIAVNIGESDFSVRKYAEQHNLTFPIVNDTDGQVQSVYGIGKILPATYLIDKHGKVVKFHPGEMDEQTVQELIESIKP